MKTIGVTSPLTRGAEVRAAQQRLAGGNVFKTDYLRARVDGAFGEVSGRGCIRAKYHMGYPLDELEPIYGDKLDGFLSGRKTLPPTYSARRRARLKAASERPLRLKALDQAMRYVGQKEQPPNSNQIAFATAWYGMVGPWCAMAVTRWYVDAGSKEAFLRGTRWAYVPYMLADAKAGRYHTQILSAVEAKPGDLVLYDWQRNGVPDHVGLLVEALGGGDLVSVEGNTARGNDSDGGQVMVRGRGDDRGSRNLRHVSAFVRVGR